MSKSNSDPYNPNIDPNNSSINPNPQSRPRRNKIMMQMELDKMYELLVAGATDRQLIKALGMSERLYYYYKNKLYDRADKLQKTKTEKVISHAQQVFADRLLRMVRLIDRKLNENYANLSGEDIVNLVNMSQELNLNLFRLEAECYRVTTRDAFRLNSIEKHQMSKYLEHASGDDKTSTASEYYTDSNGIVQLKQPRPPITTSSVTEAEQEQTGEELEELEEVPPDKAEAEAEEQQQSKS